MSDISSQLFKADASRLAPLINHARRPDKAERDGDDPADDEIHEKFLDVRELRTQFIDYLTTKVDEIAEQQDARHYYHGAQYTPRQIELLRRRHQPPLTWNRVSRKINGIVGLVERTRSDPKALPRSVKSEQGANIATQVIRYVLDGNDWNGVDPWCLLQSCIDGIAGVQLTLTEGDEGDPDIGLGFVIGDEFFYDPTAYRQDFADARYLGISKWMAVDEAIELFPDKADLLRSLMGGDTELTTNPDREYKWVIQSTQSVRLVEHWYKHHGEWRWAFYVSTTLLDQGLSPFYDDKGKRCSPFKVFSCAVDHDGDRYGFVRNLKGAQDSLNQSKSKTLHIANSRRLIGEKGAVDDVERARTEWARPDGYVEVNPGKQIRPDDTRADLQAFVQFAEDAKSEIDQFANINVATLSGAQITNISGRAIELLRAPGMAELGPFVLAYRQWKLGLYRLIWNTAQRHWTGERWLRVTENEGLAQFIHLNGLGLDQFGRPTLVNALGALDVDIILEEGADVASVMQDTYETLRGYPPGTFPPQVLIEMSSLPRSEKNRILQMMTPKPAPPNPAAVAAQHLHMEGMAARNAKTAADARKSDAAAQHSLAMIGKEVSATDLEYAQFQQNLLREAGQFMAPPQQNPQPAAPQAGPAHPQAPLPIG